MVDGKPHNAVLTRNIDGVAMRGRKWLSAALLRMTAPVASRQLPGIVRRFQQQVPCSIGATRRNVDNSRAFDHIGRFSPSAVHRCAMLGMPGRGDVPATDDGMGEETDAE